MLSMLQIFPLSTRFDILYFHHNSAQSIHLNFLLEISSLNHGLFGSVFCFQVFGEFQIILPLLISSLTSLWSEIALCIISILLLFFFLRLDFWPRLSLLFVLWDYEKKGYVSFVGWSTLQILIRYCWLMVPWNSFIYLLFFCLVVLLIPERRLLMLELV